MLFHILYFIAFSDGPGFRLLLTIDDIFYLFIIYLQAYSRVHHTKEKFCKYINARPPFYLHNQKNNRHFVTFPAASNGAKTRDYNVSGEWVSKFIRSTLLQQRYDACNTPRCTRVRITARSRIEDDRTDSAKSSIFPKAVWKKKKTRGSKRNETSCYLRIAALGFFQNFFKRLHYFRTVAIDFWVKTPTSITYFSPLNFP